MKSVHDVTLNIIGNPVSLQYNPLPKQRIRMLLISLFFISLPGVWSYTFVSGYARYKCVKRPPPQGGIQLLHKMTAYFRGIDALSRT